MPRRRAQRTLRAARATLLGLGCLLGGRLGSAAPPPGRDAPPPARDAAPPARTSEPPARAATEPLSIAPASDGHLAAWLLAATVARSVALTWPSSALAPRFGEPCGGEVWAPRWQVVATPHVAVDLARLLPTASKAGTTAFAGGELLLAEPLEGWLMLQADGELYVHIDDRLVWQRRAPRERGDTWDVIPLVLPAGSHRVVLALHRRQPEWSFEVRIVDRQTLLAPERALWSLPGTEATSPSAVVSQLLEVRLEPGLGGDGYVPRLQIAFPGGAPLRAALTPTVTMSLLGGASPWSRELALGAVPVGRRGVRPLEARLPRLPLDDPALASTRRLRVDVALGDARARSEIAIAPDASRAARAAHSMKLEVQSGARSGLSDPATVVASLDDGLTALAGLGGDPRRDPAPLRERARHLSSLVETLRQGRDPLRAGPGVIDLALRRSTDGGTDRFLLHVPAGYDPAAARTWPLVVVLHGFRSNPERILHAFLDRSLASAQPTVDAFVLAPHAHGDAFYRDAGETVVMDGIDWVSAHFRIDPRAISVSGVSMGGTGAAQLAFRHADRFAAVSALAGYHSYFLRRDTRERRLRPWELARMHHWSTMSWADNGLLLPLHVAHGQQDKPLQNSRVLTARYLELGYSLLQDWPDTGHAVWKRIYDGAGEWRWLRAQRLPERPERIVIKTDALRYARRFWASIEALREPGRMGTLRVEARAGASVRVEAPGVAAFSLARANSPLPPTSPVAVEVEGQSFSFEPGAPIALQRGAERWQRAAAQPAPAQPAPAQPAPAEPTAAQPTSAQPALGSDGSKLPQKRPGLEGPIRDIFLGPVALVHASRDAAARRATREVAERFAASQLGDAHYPLVADVDVSPELERSHHLIVVGSEHVNRFHARLAARLPVRVGAQHLELGTHRFEGAGLGALYIHPNPDHPERYVVVLTGVDLPGLYRVLCVPRLLPDFLVYDEGIDLAAGQQVLGPARVVAGGFFRNDWSLPADIADPFAPLREAGPAQKAARR